MSPIITLHPIAPYDFIKTAAKLKSYREMFTVEHGMIVRTIRPELEASPVLIRAKGSGSVDEPSINVEVIGTDYNEVILHKQLERMFAVNMNIGLFYQKIQDDPVMHQIVTSLYGFHMVLDADVFECLVRTIIGQQVNIAFATTLTKRLIELSGDRITVDGRAYPVFPTPSAVARLTVEQLRALQFSARKAEYIINLAKIVSSGELNLESLYEMDDEQVMDTLLPLRGIGRWTVECLLIFGLGRENLLPAADIGIRNAVRNAYGLEQQASEEEVRQLGKAWEPYRSYATFYLWESLC